MLRKEWRTESFSLFSTDVLDLAKEFNFKTYLFYASGATLLSFCLHFPQLHQEAANSTSKSLLELTDHVHVPGCGVPFQVKDLPDPTLFDRSMNTFTDLEADAVRALQQEHKRKNNDPFVYPVGPIIQTEISSEVNRLECLTWLDNQPPKSMLYISFGSGGTVSQEQLNEIAFG
ncbi:hypothetical protein PIB30_010036 [Stylosanthes scabra]|uniref:Uncharacterized protein n=1 Tax=Stylosanthes scabra TaxID=79078 RepID=A0ABU6W3D0_9FABA|nr:hypothetical protein [Stylosanthes scabra]